MKTDARELKQKLTVTAAGNVRRGYEKDQADRGIRVAGHSACFADLSKGLQDAVIARTEQSFL